MLLNQFYHPHIKDWTRLDYIGLETGLAVVDKNAPDRWFQVALFVPGKSENDVLTKYKELEAGHRKFEASFVPISKYRNCVNYNKVTQSKDSIGHKRSSQSEAGSSNKKKRKKYNKYEKWEAEDKRLFLEGIRRHGKGSWTKICADRDLLPHKTPLQVSSYAQKFFNKQDKLNAQQQLANLNAVQPQPANLNAVQPQQQLANLNAVQPQQPANLNAVQPQQLANLNAVQPQQPANLNAVQPLRQLANLNAVQPLRQLANLNAIQPLRQLANLNAVQPLRQLANLNAVQPLRQLSNLNAVQPQQRATLNAVQPQQPADLNAVQRQPANLNAVQPQQLANLNAIQPQQPAYLNSFQPHQPANLNAVQPQPVNLNAVQPQPANLNVVEPQQLANWNAVRPQQPAYWNAVRPQQPANLNAVQPQPAILNASPAPKYFDKQKLMFKNVVRSTTSSLQPDFGKHGQGADTVQHRTTSQLSSLAQNYLRKLDGLHASLVQPQPAIMNAQETILPDQKPSTEYASLLAEDDLSELSTKHEVSFSAGAIKRKTEEQGTNETTDVDTRKGREDEPHGDILGDSGTAAMDLSPHDPRPAGVLLDELYGHGEVDLDLINNIPEEDFPLEDDGQVGLCVPNDNIEDIYYLIKF